VTTKGKKAHADNHHCWEASTRHQQNNMNLRGKRTIINVTVLNILASLGKVSRPAAQLVVVSVDVGVGGAGVALNEEKKLGEHGG
jgi:hypothetical protein